MAQVISQDNLVTLRQGWKENGQCLVFAGGCFDLLHPGHVRLLEQARSHGDILVVGVASDAGVRGQAAGLPGVRPGTHGSVRPITPADERAEILSSLAAVDYVVEYDDLSAGPLIARLAPDIVVEGGTPVRLSPTDPDSASGTLAGVLKPKLIRILLEPGFSTARLIERIKQSSA